MPGEIRAKVVSVTLPSLRSDVLSVNDTMTNDQVLEVRERLIHALAETKELFKTLDVAILEWMAANKCDLVINENKRLYPGKDKRVKCNDTAATLEALFEATGGDMAEGGGK